MGVVLLEPLVPHTPLPRAGPYNPMPLRRSKRCVDQGLGRLGSLLRAPRNLSRPCRVRRQQAGGRAEAQRLRIAPAFCGTDRRE